MFTIDEKTGEIALTRGDSAKIAARAVYVDKDQNPVGEYQFTPTDTLTLTVRKNTKKDSPILLQKVLKGSTMFALKPSDTRGLEFGKYVYDIELEITADEVYTIVAPSVFKITEEVTF